MTIIGSKACELEILAELSQNHGLLDRYAKEYFEKNQDMSANDLKNLDQKLKTYYEENQDEAVLNAANFIEENKRIMKKF